MTQHIFSILVLVSSCVLSMSVTAQEKNYLLTSINIEGNERTQDYIIKRELSFQVGDSINIHNVAEFFRKAKRQLDFMGIFSDAEFNLSNLSNASKTVEVDITVEERWPIYPVPILELADRNFNLWWNNYNHSLRRLNYGLKFYHLNLSGRNDQLIGKVQLGFSQKYEVKYNLPSYFYLPNWGFKGSVLYSQQKEIRYTTYNQRERFLRDEDNILLHRLRIEGGLKYRAGIYHRFTTSLGYYRRVINDLVTQFNPNYFGNSETEQTFFKLSAEWIHDNRDNRAFARKGKLLKAELHRYGLHPNQSLSYWSAIFTANVAVTFNEDWTMQLNGKMRKQFTDAPLPYSERRAVNWEDVYLEGYDYYFLDGQDYAYFKTGIYYRFLTTDFEVGEWVPIESYENLNFDVFIGGLASTGYVQDSKEGIGNYLTNRLLYGIGPELKVLVNNFVTGTFQLGVNHLGEVQYYLRARVAFTP